MSGRRGSRGDERSLLSPGRSGDGDGDGGGDDDHHHRPERMPGCLGLFAALKKRRAAPSARTGRVAAAPPPPPRAPPAQDMEDLRAPYKEELLAPVMEEVKAADMEKLPAELDSLIVSKLSSIFDRSTLQDVSGRWRVATLNCPSAPLPLIINADYTLTNYFVEGPDCLPQRMNEAIQHSAALGSLGNWIGIGYEQAFNPQGNHLDPIHDEFYLVQPINGGSMQLPSPSAFKPRVGRAVSLQVLDGNDTFSYSQPARQCRVRLQKVALYRSPGLYNFKIAGLATERGQNRLVFCTPHSETWTLSSSGFITIGSDLEFFQEKLFILGRHQTELFMIEFGPHLCCFPTVSLVRRCAAIDIPAIDNTHQQRNLVRGEDHLWLVVRYFTLTWDQLTAVRVFQLDTDSLAWTEKMTIGSLSILVSLSSSECIDASAHKEISSDSIYFLDHFCPNFLPADDQQFSYRSQMYNLKTRAITEQLIGREAAIRRPGYPMFFFPSG